MSQGFVCFQGLSISNFQKMNFAKHPLEDSNAVYLLKIAVILLKLVELGSAYVPDIGSFLLIVFQVWSVYQSHVIASARISFCSQNRDVAVILNGQCIF
jgi:hypothetical protein